MPRVSGPLPCTPPRAPRRAAAPVVDAVASIVAAILVTMGCGTLLAGCGARDLRADDDTYVVREGDTLYSIARRHGLDYRDVARWNGLGRDFLIVPGQVLVLAPGGRRPAPPARDGGVRAATAPRATAGAGASSAAAAPPDSATPPAPTPPLDTLPWTWPTDGRVAGPVSRPSGGVGLRIDGTEGQEVRAAAPGRVVYVGSGLRAYGQLVIVKHDDAFLTAYGHNDALLVREGDEVQAGQPIARMGLGPGNVPMLYFEIRWNGRPVDPRPFLPRR